MKPLIEKRIKEQKEAKDQEALQEKLRTNVRLTINFT
jgi:hypothetical protein